MVSRRPIPWSLVSLSYLLDHDSSERVCNEYQRALNLLTSINISFTLAFVVIRHLCLFPLVHQARQQAFGMINDLRRRLSKRSVGIVAEDLLGEEISQPEPLRCQVCPCGEGIAAEAMEGYDTIHGLRQRTTLERRMLKLMSWWLKGGVTRWQETRLALVEGR
jgi:hypothetical protein